VSENVRPVTRVHGRRDARSNCRYSIARATRAVGEALLHIDPTQSEELLERSFALSEPLGLELHIGVARNNLARLHAQYGRPDAVLRVCSEMLRAHLRIGAMGELSVGLAWAAHALTLQHPELAATITECIRQTEPTTYSTWKLE
jgi:hypothetical protein